MTDYEKLLEDVGMMADRLLTRCGPDDVATIRRLAAALREVVAWSDDENAQPEADSIRAAHPTRTGKHETYAAAMRLVGARRSKGALVDLVNWLLAERNEALGVGCDEASEELRQHVANVACTCEYMGARGDAQALRKLVAEHRAALAIIGKIRCVFGKAGTDDDVLDAVRSALADVEAMRAVVDAGREIAEYEDCGQQYCGFCDHPLPDCSGVCCPGSSLRAALRALDARDMSRRGCLPCLRDPLKCVSGGCECDCHGDARGKWTTR